MANVNITIETKINLPIKQVWDFWTLPEHIMNWNSASDDWHTPSAENNLKPGGEFHYLMAAKDGSMQFDFWGTYDEVVPEKYTSSTLGDGRKVTVEFEELSEAVRVVENFEVEQTNTVELQRNGWQAILNHFKSYSEQYAVNQL